MKKTALGSMLIMTVVTAAAVGGCVEEDTSQEPCNHTLDPKGDGVMTTPEVDNTGVEVEDIGGHQPVRAIPTTPAVIDPVENDPVEMEEVVESAFYGFSLNSLEGEPVSMRDYQGTKVLVVNVASHCGFTYQYEALQDLHETHGDKVHVLGIPSNDFGHQEPGTSEEIRAFCDEEYGVTFDMFEKIVVQRARTQHPMYMWLTNAEANGWNDQAPTWNFYKYLIDEEGRLMEVFDSEVEPMSDDLLEAIQTSP
ncbi:MAG: hypothetical protein AAFS10_01750 [Myxococcota bacterium]